jgi:lysophospholipase L1-like esterase
MVSGNTAKDKKGSWLTTFVTITVIALLMLILVEAGFRILRASLTDPGAARDPRVQADGYAEESWPGEYFKELHSLRTVWKSYVYWRWAQFDGKYINIDERGIRRTWNRVREDTGEIKTILCLGGSSMWGFGARDDYTIASYISKLVDEAGVQGYQVINMGESGYVSTQELIALNLELQAGRVPDMVIFYDGVNDVFSAYQNDRAGLPQNENNRRYEFNLLSTDTRTILSTYVPILLGRTATFKTLRDFAYNREIGAYHDWTMGLKTPPVAKDKASRLGKDTARAYAANIRLALALARAYGFELRFYWQPTIFQKDHCSKYEEGFKEDMKSIEPLFREAYRAVLQSPEIEAASPNFKDLSGVFRKTKAPVFIDFCHIIEDGNRVIAQKMFLDIKDLIMD